MRRPRLLEPSTKQNSKLKLSRGEEVSAIDATSHLASRAQSLVASSHVAHAPAAALLLFAHRLGPACSRTLSILACCGNSIIVSTLACLYALRLIATSSLSDGMIPPELHAIPASRVLHLNPCLPLADVR